MDPPPPKKPRGGEALPPVNLDEISESPPDPQVEERPPPVAHAEYFSCPAQPYTLTFDWANSAETQLKGSRLEVVGVGPTSPTHLPFTNAGWYQVRIGPAINRDGSHRTQAVLKLPQTWVRVLEEDSPEPDVINVLLSLCSCSIEVAKPENGWRGGIKTETGVTVTFEDTFLLTPDRRTLRVPFHSNQAEVLEPVHIVRGFWWSPAGPYQAAAAEAMPNPPGPDIEALGQIAMNRLRVAGFTSAHSLYVFLRHGQMLLPSVGAPSLFF